MELILEHKDLKLIKKYGNFYIRFIEGQTEEYPYDLIITDEEGNKIITSHETINEIFESYKKRVPWTKNIL